MGLSTYTELKSAIANYLENDALTTYIDDFIDLAEAEHRIDVQIRDTLVFDTLALSDGDRTVSLPSDFAMPKKLRIRNPVSGALQRYLPTLSYVTEDELEQKSTNNAQPPKYFTVHESIEFDSEIDQDYTADITYWKEVTALSDSNTSNEILAAQPGLYLYGALKAAEPFMENDARIQTWQGQYDRILSKLRVKDGQSRHFGRLVPRAKGV